MAKKKASKKKKKQLSKQVTKGIVPDIDAELAKLELKIADFNTHVVKPPKSVKPVDIHKDIDKKLSEGIVQRPIELMESIESKKSIKDIVSATKVENAIEKEVGVFEKELKRDEKILKKEWTMPDNMGSLTFYFLSSIVCIGLLAFLFGTVSSFIFYTVFGMLLWWWSHQFHKLGEGFLKSFLAKGFVIILLYIVYWVFDDLLSLIICIMYALSFVIGGILFFYHSRRDISEEIHKSFARTFLVIFYAHIMAFTAASAIAYLIPFALPDYFVSFIFLMFVWLLPTLIIYFFFTKYLYLHFFDKKHWAKDLKKALGHSLIYSVVLVFIIILAYLLTAMQFVGMERVSYDDSFNEIFKTLQNAESDIEAAPFKYDNYELVGMRVAQDVVALADDQYRNATRTKTYLKSSALSFWDYLSDNYFTLLMMDRLGVSVASTKSDEISEIKDDLFREYDRMKRFDKAGYFDDGTTNMEDHGVALAFYLSENYLNYERPADSTELHQRMHSFFNSYGGLVADGALLDFNRDYYPDMGLLGPGECRFGEQFYDMLYHTVIFRDLMVLSFTTIDFQTNELIDPSTVRYLFVDADESFRSRILRYRIVKANLDATLAIDVSNNEVFDEVNV